MSPDSLPTDADLARIRSRANEMGLTTAALAARIGRHETYLRTILDGGCPMSRPVRAKLDAAPPTGGTLRRDAVG